MKNMIKKILKEEVSLKKGISPHVFTVKGILLNRPDRLLTNIGGKDTYIKLNKGDVITFNGSKTYHGVEPVSKGTRLSFNLWTSKLPSNLL